MTARIYFVLPSTQNHWSTKHGLRRFWWTSDFVQTKGLARLKGEWEEEYRRWQARDLSARRYVYVWADGVYLQVRMEPQAECMLVLIGATPEGKKELPGFQMGEIVVGDGALAFWKALEEIFPATRHQRCWVHKTLNVLDKLPKSVQPNAHRDLREIWLSPNRAAAETAMTTFAEKYAPKYDKAVDCLLKDRDALLTFFDFPAEHWTHLRTSDEIDKRFFCFGCYIFSARTTSWRRVEPWLETPVPY